MELEFSGQIFDKMDVRMIINDESAGISQRSGRILKWYNNSDE